MRLFVPRRCKQGRVFVIDMAARLDVNGIPEYPHLQNCGQQLGTCNLVLEMLKLSSLLLPALPHFLRFCRLHDASYLDLWSPIDYRRYPGLFPDSSRCRCRPFLTELCRHAVPLYSSQGGRPSP